MLDKIKAALGLKKPEPVAEPKAKRTKKVTKTAKEIATEKGEPYVAILNITFLRMTSTTVHLNWIGMKSLWQILLEQDTKDNPMSPIMTLLIDGSKQFVGML